MSIGTITFQRFNGVEQFAIRQADLFAHEGEDSTRLSFDFEADTPPLKTLPDTEDLGASPNGEFNIELESFDATCLAGNVFIIPYGDDDDGNWLARIYYVEHDAANNCKIRVH